MTPAKLRLAQAAMAKRDTKVGELCKELGVTRQTLYRFVVPKGELRADGRKLLELLAGALLDMLLNNNTSLNSVSFVRDVCVHTMQVLVSISASLFPCYVSYHKIVTSNNLDI
jgi:hypothetical protein